MEITGDCPACAAGDSTWVPDMVMDSILRYNAPDPIAVDSLVYVSENGDTARILMPSGADEDTVIRPFRVYMPSGRCYELVEDSTRGDGIIEATDRSAVQLKYRPPEDDWEYFVRFVPCDSVGGGDD